MDLIVALTATNRLDQLQRSLASLHDYVGPFFRLKLIIHHDDVYGPTPSPLELATAVAPYTHDTPLAFIFGPKDKPSHGAAIKRLWSHPNLPTQGYFLHWEDDFVAVSPLLPCHKSEVQQAGVGMGALYYPGLCSDTLSYVRDEAANHRLGTSPRFIQGSFARRYAELIDPSLCPEKQTYVKVRTDEWNRFHRWGHAGVGAEAIVVRAVGTFPSLVEHQGEEWNRRNGVTRKHVGARVLRTEQGRPL